MTHSARIASLVAVFVASAFAQGQPATQPAAPAAGNPPAATTPAATTPAASPPAASAPAAPAATSGSDMSGKLAYYGRKFKGRKTASGERYNPDAMTMAHKTLPFGTVVKVTNKANGKTAQLRVNDRGPTKGDGIGDVSVAAAKALAFGKHGEIDADISVVSEPAKKTP
jgi:rare lipoprotein A